jgi:Trypsin
VSSIILHSDWSSSSENFDADIALLMLSESHENISPICIPPLNSLTSKSEGIVMSWIDMEPTDPGYWNHNFNLPYNYPIKYVMPIRSLSQCVQLQPRFTSIISNRTICAGGLNSVACLEVANSGASMSIKQNDTFFLYGIVSSSFIDIAGCDNITFTLLTEVSKFHEWLNENISI